MRASRAWTWLALAVVATGCSHCGSKAARQSAERLIPSGGHFILAVPNLGALADRAQALLATARGGAGGQQLVAWSANLARQLGFDPLTRDGLKAAGIDPQASLALAAGGSSGPGVLVAIPVGDESVLEATVDRLAKDRADARVKSTRSVQGKTVTVLSRASDHAPLFAYAPREGFLLLGVGRDAARDVAQALLLAPEKSIAASPLYLASRQKVGPRDIYFYLPRSGSKRFGLVPDVAAVGLKLSAKELAARAYLALPNAQDQAWAATVVGGGAAELAELPRGAPFYLRGGIDWPAVAKQLGQSRDGGFSLGMLREAARSNGIDLDEDVLQNLAPGFALSLGLAPKASLATALDFDPRISNPFHTYSLVAVGQVKDAKRAAATLAKLSEALNQCATCGLTVTSARAGSVLVYTERYAEGEGLSWALVGKELVVSGGERLPAILASIQAKKDTLKSTDFAPAATSALFGEPGIACAADFEELGQMVKALPDSAYGTGPSSFMVRSLISGVVDPLSRLTVVAAVAPVAGGVTLDLSVAAK